MFLEFNIVSVRFVKQSSDFSWGLVYFASNHCAT